MPTASAPSASRARAGRVLVECLVSLVLVSGASSLVLLLASTTAHVVDHARQRELVRRESARLRAHVLRAPCLAATATERQRLGLRTVLESVVSASGALHTVAVTASWHTSGLGGGRTLIARTGVAGWCE